MTSCALLWAGIARAEPSALERARDAFRRGELARAVALALPLTHGPEADAAWRVVGVARCWQHDRDGARAAYDQLAPDGAQRLRAVCARAGVALP